MTTCTDMKYHNTYSMTYDITWRLPILTPPSKYGTSKGACSILELQYNEMFTICSDAFKTSSIASVVAGGVCKATTGTSASGGPGY